MAECPGATSQSTYWQVESPGLTNRLSAAQIGVDLPARQPALGQTAPTGSDGVRPFGRSSCGRQSEARRRYRRRAIRPFPPKIRPVRMYLARVDPDKPTGRG